MESFKQIIKALADRSLTDDEATTAFECVMTGEATPAQIGAFLMALRLRGETPVEITAGARTMRAKALAVSAPECAIDLVGTGGDGANTYNISTAAALVVAACGVPVAKHGNKAASSRSGAAEVLRQLGVDLSIDPAGIEACLREAGIGFMFAANHHAAMRHVAPVRAELGIRTIFNLLGPLSNPAGVRRMVIGVYDPALLVPFAEALRRLGAERAWIVHGQGLDELTTTGASQVASLSDDGTITEFEVTPDALGLERRALADLVGGEPAENAAALTRVLGGEAGAYRDIVLLNAAAGLLVGGACATLEQGIDLGRKAIDDGRARATLEKLVATSTKAAA